MNKSLILVLLLSISSLAYSNSEKLQKKASDSKQRLVAQDIDDCTMNFSTGISSLIDAKSTQLSSYLGIAKDTVKKIQLEAAVLTDGRQLIATSGGCAHIAHGFSYSATGIETDRQAVDAMIKYLELTPTTQEGSNVKKIWLNALTHWTKEPKASVDKVIHFENGDASLILKYNNKSLLQIQYDFAL